MYFATTNQLVLLILMVSITSLVFKKKKKIIEAEAFEINRSIKKSFSFRCSKVPSSIEGVDLGVC